MVIKLYATSLLLLLSSCTSPNPGLSTIPVSDQYRADVQAYTDSLPPLPQRTAIYIYENEYKNSGSIDALYAIAGACSRPSTEDIGTESLAAVNKWMANFLIKLNPDLAKSYMTAKTYGKEKEWLIENVFGGEMGKGVIKEYKYQVKIWVDWMDQYQGKNRWGNLTEEEKDRLFNSDIFYRTYLLHFFKFATAGEDNARFCIAFFENLQD